MKQKYIIRETSVPMRPPYTPLYFHGFTTHGAGVCMVFGHTLAAEYDTLEAARRTLVKVKELSGRDTWDVDVRVQAPTHKFTPVYGDRLRSGEDFCMVCEHRRSKCTGVK